MAHQYKDTFLTQNSTIIEALKIIDLAALQIVLIVNDDCKLIGTITDGDIRRAILNGVQLTDTVDKVMNTSPKTATQNDDTASLKSIMHTQQIHRLPILDEQGCVVDLACIEDFTDSAEKEHKNYADISIVLMLGGLGTRLMPLTENLPKPMIEVGGKPLLETIVTHLRDQGFKNFYFSVNYKAEIIEDYFKDGHDFGVKISYLYEDKRMGTAGALSLIPDQPKGPLIIMNGDILTNNNFAHLVDFHKQTNAMATMCVREYQQQVPYGVVRTKGTKLDTIVEKPSQTYFVNAGIYILNPTVLEHVPKDQYLDMPTLFTQLEEENYESSVFPIREYWLDIGNPQDLEKGRAEYHQIFSNKKA